KSIEGVDDVYLQTAYTLGASRLQILTKILVPIASGELFDALRLSFGVGWTYIMMGEMVAADKGLGFMIINYQRRNQPDVVYFVILLIVAIGFTIDKALEF